MPRYFPLISRILRIKRVPGGTEVLANANILQRIEHSAPATACATVQPGIAEHAAGAADAAGVKAIVPITESVAPAADEAHIAARASVTEQVRRAGSETRLAASISETAAPAHNTAGVAVQANEAARPATDEPGVGLVANVTEPAAPAKLQLAASIGALEHAAPADDNEQGWRVYQGAAEVTATNGNVASPDLALGYPIGTGAAGTTSAVRRDSALQPDNEQLWLGGFSVAPHYIIGSARLFASFAKPVSLATDLQQVFVQAPSLDGGINKLIYQWATTALAQSTNFGRRSFDGSDLNAMAELNLFEQVPGGGASLGSGINELAAWLATASAADLEGLEIGFRQTSILGGTGGFSVDGVLLYTEHQEPE